MPNIAIIGAGPAGMMAAIKASELGAKVTVFEKNHRQGRKLLITGKGRCNITNNCEVNKLIENTAHNARFLYSAFNAFTPADTMAFFESCSVKLKTERGARVFPESDKSTDINDALVNCCIKNGVRFVCDSPVTAVKAENGAVCSVECGEKSYPCDRCIIATGGLSYPLTGSTGDGYRFAKELGHTVTEILPSLVPLETSDKDCRELQGLALKNISITVKNEKGKKVYTDFGELLFTHFGISGPVVLSASSHMEKALNYLLTIDLKPALTPEQLDARIMRELAANQNKNISNAARSLLPAAMVPIVLRRAGISPETKVNSVTKEQRAALRDVLKEFDQHITSFRPIDEAIISAGGVKVGEINPKTMESKLVSGLYFCGEVIDVDAHTGGFNLQIALSTGFCAGGSAAEE